MNCPRLARVVWIKGYWMYCSNCDCTFDGWSYTCPVCHAQLLPASSHDTALERVALEYEELVQRVRQAGGEIRFDVHTHAVKRRSTIRFPYFGFGEAFEAELHGEEGDVWANFRCIEVGRSRALGFAWRGFGFAWASTLEGLVCGNPALLQVERVGRVRGWSFPFFGYGYAWGEGFSGGCGELITLNLQLLEKHHLSRRKFLYRGFGYAWGKSYMATLSLR
jgi:hypothetical protein